DIMTMAEGLSSGYQPTSAISLGPGMAETILNANEEPVQGFTYSAHPVATALARKNLELMVRGGVRERLRQELAPSCQGRLRERCGDHPLVGEVRGEGLLAAVELVADKPARTFFPDIGTVGTQCRNYCFNSGLVCRAIRDTMVLAPPLVISETEIDEILDLL